MSKRLPVKITTIAWAKIRDIIKTTGSKGMVMFVSSGGCNGFNYNLRPVEHYDGPKTDLLYGPEIYIDPMSEMFILGTEVDYVAENYAEEVYESKFIFKSNNSVSCGCGVSFTPSNAGY